MSPLTRMLGVTSLALLCLGGSCGDDAPPPAPTVATASPVRGSFEVERQEFTWAVRGPSRVEEESVVRTGEGARGTLLLDLGAWLLLDQQTELEVWPTNIRPKSGRFFVDARDTRLEIQTPHGLLFATDATFAYQANDDGAEIYCASGEVTFAGDGGDLGEDARAVQGEVLTLVGAEATVAGAELWHDWTGGLADPTPRAEAAPSYVGVLAGRQLHEFGVARRPLSLRSHEVDVDVRGDLAVTEVVQTYFNAESAVLDGEHRMRLPEGAIVSAYAVDMGGGFVEGEVLPLMSSGYAPTWDEGSVGTARLVYDGPGQLRSRVHPVAPGATVRVKVRYVEWLHRELDRRTYRYPMRSEDAAPPLIGELRITVRTSGTKVGAFRAGMGARQNGDDIVLRQSDWRPTSDFYLDLIDHEDVDRHEGALAFVVDPAGTPMPGTDAPGTDAPDAPTTDTPAAEGAERFVLFEVPTTGLPESESWDSDPGLDLVVVVDTSGATEAEDLELARSVVEGVFQQLSPQDRVALHVGDHSSRPLDDALAPLDDARREALLSALGETPLGGATDLGAMLRSAGERAANKPRGAVLYVGDALPTTGALDTVGVRAQLATIAGAPRFFGLATGEGANLGLLRSLFGDDAAHAVAERTGATRVILDVLAEAARPMLRDVQVELGPGIERVYPRTTRAGGIVVPERTPLRVVGRVVEDLPGEITLRGTRDGRAFEQVLAVRQETLDDEGDIRRRWASARLAELLAEDAGREALVELGARFGVLTPWTSWVSIGSKGGGYWPVRGFDLDPAEIDWAAGGGTTTIRPGAADVTREVSGWRRRRPRSQANVAAIALEDAWPSRVSEAEESAPVTGDGGLAQASVSRALQRQERGARSCYERRLLVRPDLSGTVSVKVEVEGDGSVKDASVVSSSLGASDVVACVLTEVRGVRFPATGGSVSVTYHYRFDSGGRGIGTQRRCSDASRQSLDVRRNLWRERLAANGGVHGAVSVWQEAQRQCELTGWRARRVLLDQMLRSVGNLSGRIALYHRLEHAPGVASYLRRAILRSVRTPAEVVMVRAGLGLDASVDWSVFSRLWKRAGSPAARLALVRAWLEVMPEEMDLRLRLLALLEETEALPEARRVARELRADPLADARVRTAVGEFWLRQGDEDEARRIFSEIVEHAPYDPWARRRLGDLYRAHGWFDDAYREYRSLARLRPDDPAVWLLLARAAAGAGRLDEALRLEQRLSESVAPGHLEGVAGVARLWSTVRLMTMAEGATEEERAMLRRRRREAGILRDPPDLFVALTWAHPDDAPTLEAIGPWMPADDERPEDERYAAADVSAKGFGLEAVVAEELDGEVKLRVRREERDALRDLRAQLVVVRGLGDPEPRVRTQEIVLTRDRREALFLLDAEGALTEVTAP